MNYRHLTLEQRYQIAALHRAGFLHKDIAEAIGCDPSTISRELRRNRGANGYAGSLAHGQATQRRHAASARAHLPEAVRLELVARLREKHSPDQIRGRLALLKGGQVSHTTVYRYARQLGLRHHLRHPERCRRYGTRQPGRFSDRRSIHERPGIVALRRGQIQPAFPGRDVGDVAHPGRHRAVHGEPTVEQVLGHWPGVLAIGRARRETALGLAAQAFFANQPGHALVTHGVGAGAQRLDHARTTIGAAAAGMDRVQVGPQRGLRIRPVLAMQVVVEAGDRY